MPVLSLNEAQPYLEPLAQIAIDTLLASHETLEGILNSQPQLHAIFDSSTQASMLSNIFADMVRPQFAAMGIDWVKTGRMQQGIIGGVINLRFKKLTTELNSMNVATDRQTRLYHQWALPGIPELTQVTFGYIPDLTDHTISSAFFVCPNGFRSNHWTWPLLGGDGNIGLFGADPEPIDPDVFDPNLDVNVSINHEAAENA